MISCCCVFVPKNASNLVKYPRYRGFHATAPVPYGVSCQQQSATVMTTVATQRTKWIAVSGGISVHHACIYYVRVGRDGSIFETQSNPSQNFWTQPTKVFTVPNTSNHRHPAIENYSLMGTTNHTLAYPRSLSCRYGTGVPFDHLSRT